MHIIVAGEQEAWRAGPASAPASAAAVSGGSVRTWTSSNRCFFLGVHDPSVCLSVCLRYRVRTAPERVWRRSTRSQGNSINNVWTRSVGQRGQHSASPHSLHTASLSRSVAASAAAAAGWFLPALNPVNWTGCCGASDRIALHHDRESGSLCTTTLELLYNSRPALSALIALCSMNSVNYS